MTEKTALLVIQHIEASRYLDAMQCLQDELLKIEVKSTSKTSDKRKIKILKTVIDNISEAASFGDEWEEGRRAQKAAIVRLQKLSAS